MPCGTKASFRAASARKAKCFGQQNRPKLRRSRRLHGAKENGWPSIMFGAAATQQADRDETFRLTKTRSVRRMMRPEDLTWQGRLPLTADGMLVDEISDVCFARFRPQPSLIEALKIPDR
jgi:hypothetical protein